MKLEINNCIYKTHPVYNLYASNEAGDVINIIKKASINGHQRHNGYKKCMIRAYSQ